MSHWTPIFAEIADKMPVVEGWLALNLLLGTSLISFQFVLARHVRCFRLLPALLACFWAYGMTGEILCDRSFAPVVFSEMGSLYVSEIILLAFAPAITLLLAMLWERKRLTVHSAFRIPHSASP